ncbi:MAG: DUF4340 domain-containing protein [Deltaproteobacteria bacterium]|nr:DUF4340 domain-containing protein [Deltaproteobacteria bacterium]
MRNSKTLTLLAVFALLVIGVLVDRRYRATEARLLKLGDVSKGEILFQGKRARLERVGQKTPPHWRLDDFDGAKAVDSRVNDDLVNHLLDLVRAMSDVTASPLDPKSAAEYGMKNPQLALTLAWETPQAGQEIVLFGNRNLSGQAMFAFFPKRELLVEVPSSAMALFEHKDARDLRDRRITTFDTDDVEDLVASGKCGSFKLTRDGDRWLRSGKVVKTETAEHWLGQLLQIHYDDLKDAPTTAAAAGENPVCRLELAGRRDLRESIELFKLDGTLWARNSRLPATYHLPPGVLATLVPPN